MGSLHNIRSRFVAAQEFPGGPDHDSLSHFIGETVQTVTRSSPRSGRSQADVILPAFKDRNRSVWILSPVVARQAALEEPAIKVDKDRAAPCVCRRELIWRGQAALHERVKCLASILCLHC